MRRDMINEDSNQFGPGTDLIICLLALLMILVLIVSFLYGKEKKVSDSERKRADNSEMIANKALKEIANAAQTHDEPKDSGGFKWAGEFLMAGTFEQNPFDKLRDPEATETEIESILQKYECLKEKYSYIFVIGHANEVGIKGQPDLPYEELLKRNWSFAGARSVVIANLLQRHLSEEAKNKIVIVSTGQFDLRLPDRPDASENAFVEVFFGNEWKPEANKKIIEQ